MSNATAPMTPFAFYSANANDSTAEINKRARHKDFVRLNGNIETAEGAAAYIDAFDRLAYAQMRQIDRLTKMLQMLGHHSPETGFRE